MLPHHGMQHFKAQNRQGEGGLILAEQRAVVRADLGQNSGLPSEYHGLAVSNCFNAQMSCY